MGPSPGMTSVDRPSRAAAGRRVHAALLCALACCTAIRVQPELQNSTAELAALVGRVEFDGREEYLPRTLRRQNEGDVVFTYRWSADTSRSDHPDLVTLFNPLTLFGSPTGESTARASGHLEIRRGDRPVRSYDAQASVRKIQHLYSGDSLTEIRRQALIGVRDNLDAQLKADLPSLSELLAPLSTDPLEGGKRS